MEKYLFTDGLNGVKEASSQQELEKLIDASARPEQISIWVFNSNEWMSYAAYRRLFPAVSKKETMPGISAGAVAVKGVSSGKRWLKRSLFFPAMAAGALLVFNFTKIKWEKAAPVDFTATRPGNVPLMDIDSLVEEIEYDRGEALDRSTKTNLRLRNTWPDKVELKLHSERETSSAGSRFLNVSLSIDNTTGFNIDNAVVKLSVWKNQKLNTSDTLRFSNIRYDKLLTRAIDAVYRGDSISVSFESIRAKAFNFCYSATIKNNSGNYNDRWFCRE